MLNLSAFVGFHARRTPERTAIVYREQRVSYAALETRTGRLAALLAARGITVRTSDPRGLAEEASEAYKDVADVVDTAERAGLARKVARLRPLIVVKG